MCGINGLINKSISEEKRITIVKKMNDTLAHRGPNSEGFWHDSSVSLGHRRLSIIDLSSESNQPFLSNDKRYVIVYNGELYNYKELKLELQRSMKGDTSLPYFFKTNSDTEVILAAYIRWGSKALDYFNGMFAFAIFDTQDKNLFIARDRMGVKPLYYFFKDNTFIFSSEIRSILSTSLFSFCLNRSVLAEYTMYQTVMAPNTIIRGIQMLMPGHYLEIKNDELIIQNYYSLNKLNQNQEEKPYSKVCSEIKTLLMQSVQSRMVSDVPFGAFLSGGIDSSAVVGLMSHVSTQKINTFNVSFDENEFSESKFAKLIAKKFNTQHHEIKLKPVDFLKQIPEVLSHMDFPGGDGPNTYIVSKATKEAGITMALSGIGGDELFAGYNVFKQAYQLKNNFWMQAMPKGMRSTASWLMRNTKSDLRTHRISEVLDLVKINFNSFYPLSRKIFPSKTLGELFTNIESVFTIETLMPEIPQIENHLLSSVSLAEMQSYLTNVLLRDTDQMSMAVALEVREPFLDHHLVEYVLNVNDEQKFPYTPKKLLVDSLGNLLPEEIVNRPKIGFTLPWQYWLKNELKSFCEKNIYEFAENDFCNKEGIKNLWNRFLKNDALITWSRVWHLVVLNNWLKENKITI